LKAVSEPFVGIQFPFEVILISFFISEKQIQELIGIKLIFSGVLICGLVVGLNFAFEFIIKVDDDCFGWFFWLFFV
jgi:hypothetical protein